MMLETGKKIVEKWKLISMENPICKVNLVFLIARCCILWDFWGMGALGAFVAAHMLLLVAENRSCSSYSSLWRADFLFRWLL